MNEKERKALIQALTAFIDTSRTQSEFPVCTYCGTGVTLSCSASCPAYMARDLRVRLESWQPPQPTGTDPLGLMSTAVARTVSTRTDPGPRLGLWTCLECGAQNSPNELACPRCGCTKGK